MIIKKQEEIPQNLKNNLVEAKIRELVLYISIIIGLICTLYFGIRDAINHRTLPMLASTFTIIIFGCILFLYKYLPVFKKSIEIFFTLLVAVIFIALLLTGFPDPTINLWLYTFPFLAFFILGHKNGIIVVLGFNFLIICAFIIDSQFLTNKYTLDFSIRYCAVMLVISVISYYYENFRHRLFIEIQQINKTLEKRVEERTKALEESQARLKQAEKLEAIGLLAGGITHDFNNQLAGITAYADLIRLNCKDNAEIKEYAEGILESARRSAELNAKLLSFARKSNFISIPIKIKDIISDVVLMLERTLDKRIVIKKIFNTESDTVLGDPAQIHNALLNIAINSRDAMPNGGEIIFSTDLVEFDEAYCKTIPYEVTMGSYIRISVTDNGCGMDKKTLSRVFEPFFTTKEKGKGTGLGLSTVYGIVRSHKGIINIYSELGHGTVVKIYLPLYSGPNQKSENSNNNNINNQEKKYSGNVLLVEDEKNVSKSSEKMLNMLGFNVHICHNGKDAVEYYKKNWQQINLVILDMIMPVMNGKETYIALKEINPNVLTILVSGYGINGEITSILDLGVKEFIQKPFTFDELKNKIGKIINS